MPQLDKYIFFNQIITFTFFFGLIYIYVRGTVVPEMSKILKYRKKKIELLNKQIVGYNKFLENSNSYCVNTANSFIDEVSATLSKIPSYFEKKAVYQLLCNLDNQLFFFYNEKYNSCVLDSKKLNKIKYKL